MTCITLCRALITVVSQCSGIIGSTGKRIFVELHHVNLRSAWLVSFSVYFGSLTMVSAICVLGNVSNVTTSDLNVLAICWVRRLIAST